MRLLMPSLETLVLLGWCVMTVFSSPESSLAKSPQPVSIDIDGLRVECTRPEDLSLSVDGIPFLAAPQLYVVAKNWSRKYYAFEDDAQCLTGRRLERTTSGGVQIIFSLQSPNDDFKGQLIYEIGREKRFCVFVRGELTSHTEARIEHRFGLCAPGWFVGRTWQALSQDGSTTTGVAPILARSGSLKEMTLVESFRELAIASRLYSLLVRSHGDYRFALLDYRESPYNGGELCYWLGILESKIELCRPFEYGVEINFAARPGRLASGVKTTTEPVRPVDIVLCADHGVDRILPQPKRFLRHEGETPIPSRWSVVLKGAQPLVEQREARDLIGRILATEAGRFGTSLEFTAKTSHDASALQIEFTEAARRAEQAGKFDYYRLFAGAGGVHIEVGTTGGLRCSLASLIQLLQWRNGRACIAHCDIEDFSDMPVRAVHFFTGKNGRDLQINMLRSVLLPLKFNMIIYQCDYLEWESVPQLRHERYGMSKAEARAVIEEARRLGFEVVPLVNTFGHCEWLLENDHFRHLADNPARPYAYDPSNPQVYEICERIYSEAIDLFRPRLFHIGHDEVTLYGFPEKPANKQRGAERLFYEDTLHYYEWLRSRGVRMMMWGDQLLAPGEGAGATLAHSKEQAKWLREVLPKDIIIADWHYDPNPPEEFTNLRVLTEAGFDVLACTWYSPLNILRFAKAVEIERRRVASVSKQGPRQGEVLGLMQTTWAGYSFDQESFDSSLDQYAAYVLAGQAAWTGGAHELREVPFDYRQEFARLWTRELLPPVERKGWVANLSAAANLPLDGSKFCEFVVGDAHSSSFAGLEPGEQQLGRWKVSIPRVGTGPGAVLFEGQFNPEGPWLRELTVPVNRPAQALFFVVASTVGGPRMAPIAVTTVEFDDSSTASLKWRPGVTVFGLEDGRSAPRVPVVWQNQEQGKAPRYVHGYVWKNPSPEKAIKCVKTETTYRGGALLLFALSGLE
ncbi:MAG: family 20 glycosylhydrolase [Candidatus Sumerlaeaceae bacterium]